MYMYMYVYVYVYVYLYMYICVYVYVCLYTQLPICIPIAYMVEGYYNFELKENSRIMGSSFKTDQQYTKQTLWDLQLLLADFFFTYFQRSNALHTDQ